MTTIKLNVGGKIYETRKSTLIQSKYFKTLLDDKFGNKSEDGTYFLDEDPELFIHILNKLRHPEYEYPEIQSNNLVKLADFYEIPIIQTKQQIMTAKRIVFNTKNKIDTIIKTNGKIKIISIDFNRNHKCLYFCDNDNCIMSIDTNLKSAINKKMVPSKYGDIPRFTVKDETIKIINKYEFNEVMIETNDDTKICNCIVEYEEYN